MSLQRSLTHFLKAEKKVCAYLQKQGYKRRMVEADCTTCYTVADFAREYPHGVYVLGCSGHVLAVIDGAWWDSWDSGAECPIYYWYKEE